MRQLTEVSLAAVAASRPHHQDPVTRLEMRQGSFTESKWEVAGNQRGRGERDSTRNGAQVWASAPLPT